jgi:spore maturation protein CgeB
MKILVVGSNYNWSIEKHYIKHWKQMGMDITLMPLQNLFYDYYYRSKLNKVLYRLGISTILKKINKQLKLKIEEIKPSIVFVFKGQELLPSTIQYIKKKGLKIVNYNPDSPFVFSSKGSGNKNITNALPLYDLHFSYNLSIVEKIKTTFKIPAFELPFGFELPQNFTLPAIESEINKLCFIGNPDTERAALLTYLAEANIAIDVIGNDWDKFVSNKNITIKEAIQGDDMYTLIGKYRVQLNIMRKHNLDSHNMRTFEIPGAAGIQLAPFTTDHNRYFVDGDNIFLYKNNEEAIEKARNLLALSSEEAHTIKLAAKQFSFDNKYAYQQRAEKVIYHLQKDL